MMESKTPISALQEFMVSRGKIPRYDLIKNGTGTHNPVFAYRVQVDMFWEEGEGPSKQVAKHRAAEKMLKTLNVEYTDSVCDLNFASSASSENFVGQLKDYCILQNYPDPKYEVEEEAGPPHSKIFKIVCIVSQLKQYGVSKTKKTAKQIAAGKMMELLNKCTASKETGNKNQENGQAPGSIEPPSMKQLKILPSESTDQVLEKFNSMKSNYSNPVIPTKNYACYYKDHHRAYLHLLEKSPTIVKILDEKEDVTDENAEDLLNEIATELGAVVTRTLAPKNEKDDLSQDWIFLGMSGEFLNPPLAGIGPDDKTASMNLIKSLQILCSTQMDIFYSHLNRNDTFEI